MLAAQKRRCQSFRSRSHTGIHLVAESDIGSCKTLGDVCAACAQKNAAFRYLYLLCVCVWRKISLTEGPWQSCRGS